MHKNSGYTLLELLVSVAMAVILLTTGVPSFKQTLQNSRRATQVNAFIADMAYARSEALKRGDRVSLCRSNNYADALPHCGTGDGWEDGWIVFSDSDRNGNPDEASDILRVHAALKGTQVTFRGNQNVRSRIHYAPTGGISGTMGTLIRCDGRGPGTDARQIIFPLTGRVRTTPGDGSISCDP